MNREVNIGIVAEGVTDQFLINELVCTILDKENDCRYLQPSGFAHESGWYGVLKYCRHNIKKVTYGKFLTQVRSAPLDALIIALDGDQFSEGTLYCAESENVYCGKFRSIDICYNLRCIDDSYLPCPTIPLHAKAPKLPIEARVSRMQNSILKWCGLSTKPESLIITIPCDMMETWIVAAVEGPTINGTPIEEFSHIYDNHICQNSYYHGWRTDQGKQSFFEYFCPTVIAQWNEVCKHCSQAKRFNDDILKLQES